MLETNVRIVQPGGSLYILTREARLTGPTLTAELAERACNALRRKHGLAAVPCPGKPSALVVAARESLRTTHVEDDEWELDIADSGVSTQRLSLASEHGPLLLPMLVERAFLIHLMKRTDLWTLDSSRIWYENRPFCTVGDIEIYRRYEVGSVLIDDVGVGIAVDVGTAFFSVQTLAYFFAPGLSESERKARQSVFKRLTQRQARQKGTLLYDNGHVRVKCYFADAPPEMTCGTTGTVRVKHQSYESLLGYYEAELPDLPVQASTPVVRVSFRGLQYPQPVAADRVRIRVMNENVPQSVSDRDKISPDERRRTLAEFWARLKGNPLAPVAPGFSDGMWRPSRRHIVDFAIPRLLFGSNEVLEAPKQADAKCYREHYQQRLVHLKRHGCYRVPPNMTRKLYCAYPNQIGRQAPERLSSDIVSALHELTGKEMTAELLSYDTVIQAAQQLRDADRSGMVLFILNEEPTAYYDAAFQLPSWRIKRVTVGTLDEHHGYLTKGALDRSSRSVTLERGRKRWDAFVWLVMLDVAQLLDVVPYGIDSAGCYEAQLVIDVGYEGRHFALSLLITRQAGKVPDFRIISHVYPKGDRQESINPRILTDAILDLFGKCFPKKFDSIKSLLVMRDGRIVDQEAKGLNDAIGQLKQRDYLPNDARVDWVEIHKDTMKSIRIWNVKDDRSAENALLGIGVQLNPRMIVVATTGAPTLSQGTAEPILIVGNGHCSDMVEAARANFWGAQMNWSSPRVAQKLHIGMKRTDDDLKARDAQEVRRLR